MKTGRKRSADIATSVHYCKYHDKDCEHRQWRRGLDKAGQPRLVWVCAEKHNETNKAAYAARNGG